MNRRNFLHTATALGASWLAPRRAPAAPRRVLVLGAGLAGLAAADALARAGHEVTVLEARERPGGRVLTLRAPFADGLHAEAGALTIPDNHALVRGYARRFGLPLVRVPTRAGGAVFYLRGRRVVADAGAAWPLPLTAEETALGLRGLWTKYVGDLLPGLGDVSAPGWPPAALLDRYDAISFTELLRARGASAGAIAVFRASYVEYSGDGIDTLSALAVLRDLALRRAETAAYVLRDGNDALPRALAAALGARVRYASPVTRLEWSAAGARVSVQGAGGESSLAADHVVCTLPWSVLRGLPVTPPWPAATRAAIDGLGYTSVSCVYLQIAERSWAADGPLSVNTDLPVGWIWEPTSTQPGRRGILEGYAAGAAARRLAALSEPDRVATALDAIERVCPGVRAKFERGASVVWDDDRWARGAYAWLRPGQMRALLPHVATPAGRVHFAGEHTSPWPGWMQGALHSGLRVAREIDAAA